MSDLLDLPLSVTSHGGSIDIDLDVGITLVLRPIWASSLNRNGSSPLTCIPCPGPYLLGWDLCRIVLYFNPSLLLSSWTDSESDRRSACLTAIIHWACCPCDMEDDWTPH